MDVAKSELEIYKSQHETALSQLKEAKDNLDKALETRTHRKRYHVPNILLIVSKCHKHWNVKFFLLILLVVPFVCNLWCCCLQWNPVSTGGSSRIKKQVNEGRSRIGESYWRREKSFWRGQLTREKILLFTKDCSARLVEARMSLLLSVFGFDGEYSRCLP